MSLGSANAMPFSGRNGSFVHFRAMSLMERTLMVAQADRCAVPPVRMAVIGTE